MQIPTTITVYSPDRAVLVEIEDAPEWVSRFIYVLDQSAYGLTWANVRASAALEILADVA